LFFLTFVLLGVSIIMFGLLMTFSPERRAMVYVTTPQQAKDIPALIKRYGFDQPFYKQYGRWVKEVASGNFGYSLVASRPVSEAFWIYFPVSLELALYSAPCIIIFGIWMGTKAGRHRNSAFDHFSRVFSIIGWSLPTFLFALILLMLFYGYANWFPPGILSDESSLYIIEHPDDFVRYTGLYSIDGILNGNLSIALDSLKHLVLPVLTLTVVVCAILMRVMRSGIIEEMSKDYVTTARAKGVDENTILIKHARRNALIPVITVAGTLIGFLMEGSIAVEIIFNRQGIGWWLATSAIQLDMPVLMAVCLFMGVVFVSVNLIVDILYAVIDPRIRLN
jgi:peptide/nickel transport system permease protein